MAGMPRPEQYRSFYPAARLYKKGNVTVEAPGYEPVKGETIPRRNAKAKDELKTIPRGGITTVYELLKYGSSTYGNAKAVGYRKLVKLHKETKKVKKIVDGKEQEVDKEWTYFELGGYNYMSFVEFEKLALTVGAALKKLGMDQGDKIQLFAATSPFWLVMAHGALTQSLTITTAYDTLGEEGLTHALVQTKAKAVFLDPSLFTKLINPLKKAKEIEVAIYNDKQEEMNQAGLDKLKAAHPELKVISFSEFQKLGEDNPVEPVPPKPDDVCCIMYTSGTTGNPKGVIVKHSNVVAAVAGIDTNVGDYIGPGDGLLTYLPLAHILEFVFENTCYFWGGTMGYGGFRTLSDTNVRNCKGDIREFKPTILVGVPAVFEQLKKGVLTKVNAGGFVTQKLFWGAFAAKSFLNSSGLPGTAILDSIVFNKVKDATGGKLRICMNGGGPLSEETGHFISTAIVPLIGGYGLTETTGAGALMDPLAWTSSALGEIHSGIEIKLVDFPDAGYFSTNNPPQGEIWIRGGPVTAGYLDMEKETEEAYSKDGWFKTGDIGEFDPRGNLKIIDRKKNLVKTLNGEYIALEKLESVYRSVPVVQNICVYADPNKNKPIAIVFPVEAALKKVASQNGIHGEHLEELVHDEKLTGIVLKQIQDAGRRSGLGGIEIVDGLVLVPDEWTPQNGLTTAAQKVNRKAILDKYKKDVDKTYSHVS